MCLVLFTTLQFPVLHIHSLFFSSKFEGTTSFPFPKGMVNASKCNISSGVYSIGMYVVT